MCSVEVKWVKTEGESERDKGKGRKKNKNEGIIAWKEMMNMKTLWESFYENWHINWIRLDTMYFPSFLMHRFSSTFRIIFHAFFLFISFSLSFSRSLFILLTNNDDEKYSGE